ncbi:MAG: sigma-70 family RNA polymerase sigma factor [Anaerolineae bacterium]
MEKRGNPVRELTLRFEMTLFPENADSPADGELIARLRAHDEQALLELYRRHGTLVYSIALRTLGNAQDAEEVTQDVFLQLWKKHDRYDSARGSLGGWLAVTTRNAAIDRYRHKQRHETDARALSMDDAPQLWEVIADDDSADLEMRRAVAALVGRLEPNQREAIQLAYFYGMSQSEIADRLHRPLGTIKSHIRQGMERLRQLWLSQNT